MSRVDIELRLTKTGTVFSWEVFLENTHDESRVEDGWAYDPNGNYFFVTLNDYPIADNSLDVYLGCEGKVGGKTTCAVWIDNEEQQRKVTCRNTDPDYAHESYGV